MAFKVKYEVKKTEDGVEVCTMICPNYNGRMAEAKIGSIRCTQCANFINNYPGENSVECLAEWDKNNIAEIEL